MPQELVGDVVCLRDGVVKHGYEPWSTSAMVMANHDGIGCDDSADGQS